MAGHVQGLFHHRFANLFRAHTISSRKGVDSFDEQRTDTGQDRAE